MEKDIILTKEETEASDKPPVKDITFEVEYDPIGQKFFIHLGGVEAVIAYTQVNNVLDLHHTVVPESFKGQGLAEKMCAFAFDFAKKNGFKIIPSCPYISQKFLPSHPEYKDIVTDSYF